MLCSASVGEWCIADPGPPQQGPCFPLLFTGAPFVARMSASEIRGAPHLASLMWATRHACGRRQPIANRLSFTMKIPTCAYAPAASAVPASRSSAAQAAHRNAASNHLFSLVVGLAVTAQRGGLGAGLKLCKSGGDLGVLPLEQAVAGKIALDQERPEFLHVENPDRLRQSQLLEPMDARDPLDAAPEQRAGAVSDRREIDRAVGHERPAIDLRRHSALADDDVAAGEIEPAVEPLREAERGGRGHRADRIAAVGIDARRRRAMEIGKPERIAAGGHSGAVFDRAL